MEKNMEELRLENELKIKE
jgi:hypothetical protein